MTDDTRYVRTACGCGANWIEDRMQPGPTCPVCGHSEPWDLVGECDRLYPHKAGTFDVAASDVIELLELCAFKGTLRRPKRGHVDLGRWSYEHEDADARWKMTVDLEAFKGQDAVRSVIFSYSLNDQPALAVTLIAAERLFELIADIVRTVQRHSNTPVAAAEGLLCGAPVEAN